MSTTTTIRDIRKITGRIGAEVIGVDVTQPLAAETVTYLREALRSHHLREFRRLRFLLLLRGRTFLPVRCERLWCLHDVLL